MRVEALERAVEVAQSLAHRLEGFLVHKGVEERCVVFVHKEHDLFAEFLLGGENDVLQANARERIVGLLPIDALVFRKH